MGAAFLDNADIALKPDEAKKLAEALDRVRQLYPMNFNPKMLAWLHLGTTGAGIYGPRIWLMVQGAKKRGPQKVAQPAVPIRTATPAAPMPEPKTAYSPSELDSRLPAEVVNE